MKKSLLKQLISPVKKERFKIIAFKLETQTYTDGPSEEEIVDGILMTESKEWYPIIGGIPRILIGESKYTVMAYYPEFLKKYKQRIEKYVTFEKVGEDIFSKQNKKTISKFGFQWHHFEDMDSGLNYEDWMSNAVEHKTYFKDKLSLEIGSGAGGHTLKTLDYGAEVIATDLSHAIDITHKKTKHYKKAHSLQCDLYAIPFKEKSFDFVYCLGVLQHLPNPKEGFIEMSKFVKENGAYFTNLYSNTRKSQLLIEDTLRFFITPFPNPIILFFAHIFNTLDHILQIWPYKIFKKIDPLSFLFLNRTKIYSELGFRKSLDDWFDRLSAPIIKRYSKEDMESWYKETNYKDILVYDFNNSNWVGYGVANQ
jgi:ubiquinone/menaquinone biosynthesis C-methylase UbiE/uncharacterized protein YbaR (Trm112 family)